MSHRDSNSQPSTKTRLGSRRLLLQEPADSPKTSFAIQEGKISKLCTQKVIQIKSCKPDWVLECVTQRELDGVNQVLGFFSNLNP